MIAASPTWGLDVPPVARVVCRAYASLMSYRAVAVRLIQGALLGYSLSVSSGGASEPDTKLAVPLVTNLPGQRVVGDTIEISNRFAGFVPGSLAHVVWTGFLTNGRSLRMWESWQLPPEWPNKAPVLRWNTNNIMWGRKGLTAISQVAEGMGSFGQGEITALTRRHGYLRGHGMGPSGLDPTRVGRRVWFCARDNQLVERRAKLLYIQTPEQGGTNDYSIVLFDADLPAGIEPMRVVDAAKLRRKYFGDDFSHRPVFMALQDGLISTGIPGWTTMYRAGDSGAPMMLPLPDELVFFGGLSTSPPSTRMQADMDMLSRRAHLDPRKYQMQWVNLDAYPNSSATP